MMKRNNLLIERMEALNVQKRKNNKENTLRNFIIKHIILWRIKIRDSALSSNDFYY